MGLLPLIQVKLYERNELCSPDKWNCWVSEIWESDFLSRFLVVLGRLGDLILLEFDFWSWRAAIREPETFIFAIFIPIPAYIPVFPLILSPLFILKLYLSTCQVVSECTKKSFLRFFKKMYVPPHIFFL